VLVQSFGFKEGILKMYANLHLTYDIIQFYMDQKDYNNVIQALSLYGNEDPNLWIQVLTYFVDGDQQFDKEISEVLKLIQKNDIIPPLLVIQILARKNKTQIGCIKEFLMTKLKQEQYKIDADWKKVKQDQEETERMRSQIYELKTSAKQFQQSACSYCGALLELPAVHFLCMHSFHQRCVSDSFECPVCQKKNKDILSLKKNLEDNADQHEAFFKALKKKQTNEAKHDGFSVIAEYFGKGIFNINTNEQELLNLQDEQADPRKKLQLDNNI